MDRTGSASVGRRTGNTAGICFVAGRCVTQTGRSFAGSASPIDIHDRREAEEALRESEARYRALIEVSPQMIFDRAGRRIPNTYLNQWCYDYTGLTQAESEGLRLGAGRTPGTSGPVHRDRGCSIWHRAPNSAQRSRRCAGLQTGSIAGICARGRSDPATPTGGSFAGSASPIDIHDRREAEESLRRTEEWLSEAQRLSHTGSWATQPRRPRQMVYVSNEFLRIAGLDQSDGNSLAWSDESTMLTTPADVGRALDRIHPDDQLVATEET